MLYERTPYTVYFYFRCGFRHWHVTPEWKRKCKRCFNCIIASVVVVCHKGFVVFLSFTKSLFVCSSVRLFVCLFVVFAEQLIVLLIVLLGDFSNAVGVVVVFIFITFVIVWVCFLYLPVSYFTSVFIAMLRPYCIMH